MGKYYITSKMYLDCVEQLKMIKQLKRKLRLLSKRGTNE